MNTSLEALKKYEPKAGTLRAKILPVVLQSGLRGATHSEISSHYPTDQFLGNVHKRYSELEDDSLIFRLPEDYPQATRVSSDTGNSQTVWFHWSFAEQMGVELPTCSPYRKKTYDDGFRDGLKKAVKEVLHDLTPESKKRLRTLIETHS